MARNFISLIVENCAHFTSSQRGKLLKLLEEFKELFDGRLDDWQDDPVSFKLKPGATPYHGRSFPIPKIHLETPKKEVPSEIGKDRRIKKTASI